MLESGQGPDLISFIACDGEEAYARHAWRCSTRPDGVLSPPDVGGTLANRLLGDKVALIYDKSAGQATTFDGKGPVEEVLGVGVCAALCRETVRRQLQARGSPKEPALAHPVMIAQLAHDGWRQRTLNQEDAPGGPTFGRVWTFKFVDDGHTARVEVRRGYIVCLESVLDHICTHLL